MSSYRTFLVTLIVGAVLLAVLFAFAATVAPIAELQRLDEQGRQSVTSR